MTPALWITLIAVGAVVLSIASWWGVRKLGRKHNRSAVGEPAQPGPSGPQKVAVVLNPVKAQANQARSAIRAAIADAGWPEPLFLETTVADPGYAQTRQALNWGADVVVVGGGDGTVRVVAEVLKHTPVAMGLVPLGTGNLLARNLDLDINNVDANVRTALFGYQRRVDTATMELENSVSGAHSTHTFLVIAGIGMDAEVVGDTNDGLKKSVGWLAYSEAGVRHLPGRRKKVAVALDDAPSQQRKVRSVLFANCGLLPGGIDFIPGALIDDGILDVVVISPRSALGWIAMMGKVLFKHNRKLPVIDFYRAETIVLRTAVPEETQLDGDPAGKATKVTVAVEKRALTVRVNPDHAPEEHGRWAARAS
ncbi:diacylglycerol/lipid kinase family protein [Arthrobacter russicus]|uniref:Diacylglycerol kinase family enzyme n=1 Tax=Arthrobacter russicus TaxID=172040 RepID=A0ABU1JCK6_9MICC|nr:diacylglycerol kinase family protein [Arthrobacter russicus]MDN5667387.1 diacylglycerol kinase family lipid kinase [Renibacterium salmoninarum]MDR6269626.1 diacylglycerol kinase family enzyme [Arthrobacter russicus]